MIPVPYVMITKWPGQSSWEPYLWVCLRIGGQGCSSTAGSSICSTVRYCATGSEPVPRNHRHGGLAAQQGAPLKDASPAHRNSQFLSLIRGKYGGKCQGSGVDFIPNLPAVWLSNLSVLHLILQRDPAVLQVLGLWVHPGQPDIVACLIFASVSQDKGQIDRSLCFNWWKRERVLCTFILIYFINIKVKY